MDPYEYLLKTLGVQILNNYNTSDHEIWFKNQIIDVFSKNKTAKYIFQFYTSFGVPEDNLSKDLMEYSCRYPRSDLIKLLQLFPDELESIEHVDLLLTLNGMNKET